MNKKVSEYWVYWIWTYGFLIFDFFFALDQICYTTYDEHCDDIYDQTCRAIVAKNQVRKCFNVTETVCALKEEISYELIDAVRYLRQYFQ